MLIIYFCCSYFQECTVCQFHVFTSYHTYELPQFTNLLLADAFIFTLIIFCKDIHFQRNYQMFFLSNRLVAIFSAHIINTPNIVPGAKTGISKITARQFLNGTVAVVF